jgi:hypothetical protein
MMAIPCKESSNLSFQFHWNDGAASFQLSDAHSGSTIDWLLAETEAAGAGFSEITPWHLLISFWRACDLNIAQFLVNAPEKVVSTKIKLRRTLAILRSGESSFHPIAADFRARLVRIQTIGG